MKFEKILEPGVYRMFSLRKQFDVVTVLQTRQTEVFPMQSLNTERGEGEKVSDFEKRLKLEIGKLLDV